MSTPELYLHTGYILNDRDRLVATREPRPEIPPLFTIVRSATRCAWAVRDDVPQAIAAQFDRLAREEPTVSDLAAGPAHADRYRSLAQACSEREHEATVLREFSGPAFTFPSVLPASRDVVLVEDERLLQRHFSGWISGEIAGGRAPVLAIVEDGHAVSACFCARRTDYAAEAGLETSQRFRGRGLAGQVTAAWARAARSAGLTPLYSTAWTNHASRSVAAKLSLEMYASTWSVSNSPGRDAGVPAGANIKPLRQEGDE